MSTYLRVTSDLNADKSVVFSKFGIKGDGKAFDDKGVSTLVSALDDHGTVTSSASDLDITGMVAVHLAAVWGARVDYMA